MLEFEKKFMLTKSEYDCLKYFISRNAPSISQTNYYFDTDDFVMNKKGITCRIRYKNGMYTATIKNHNINKENCNIETDLSVKTEFDPSVFSTLGLHIQGNLTTERTVIYKSSKCKVMIDRNTYLGTTDYELEIEYIDGYENEVDKLLNNITNSFKIYYGSISKEYRNVLEENNQSKSQRFFKKLKNIFQP